MCDVCHVLRQGLEKVPMFSALDARVIVVPPANPAS